MPIIHITTKCWKQELIFKKTEVCPHLTSIKLWLHKTEEEMYEKEQNISNLQWQD